MLPLFRGLIPQLGRFNGGISAGHPDLSAGYECDAGRLIAPARKRDQVLLQRRDAKGVANRRVMHRAVRTIGADHAFVAIAKKVVVTPNCSSWVPEKSPNTVASVALCIARA